MYPNFAANSTEHVESNSLTGAHSDQMLFHGSWLQIFFINPGWWLGNICLSPNHYLNTCLVRHECQFFLIHLHILVIDLHWKLKYQCISPRKRLRADLGKLYPKLSPDDLTTMVSQKEDMSITKISTHGGQTAVVYCLQKNPIFFDLYGKIYPTGI